ncbi:MAG: hypothetical protein ACNA7X_06025 [Dehalococcoidia bacterium]
MSDLFTLTGTNIVILAKNYNPSIISKEWLYKKNIVRETVTNFVHTPPLSLVETEHTSFVLDDTRLQISLKGVTAERIESLPSVASRFVSCLPETPFVAVGFNYSYSVPAEHCLVKALLAPNEAKLKQLFSKEYELGVIMSFAFKSFIVRMTAPPTVGKTTHMTIDFNFHSDSQGPDEVKKKLELHPETVSRADDIMRGLSR